MAMMENLLKVPHVMITFTGVSSPLSSLLSVSGDEFRCRKHVRKDSVTAGLISVGDWDGAKTIKGDLKQVGLNLSWVFHNAVLFLMYDYTSPCGSSLDLQCLHKCLAVN